MPTAKTDSPAHTLRAVGKMGALYLEANVKPDQILAVAWGRTLSEVARALGDQAIKGLVVAQSFGGLNSGESFNPSRVTSLVAEKFHARVYHLLCSGDRCYEGTKGGLAGRRRGQSSSRCGATRFVFHGGNRDSENQRCDRGERVSRSVNARSSQGQGSRGRHLSSLL